MQKIVGKTRSYKEDVLSWSEGEGDTSTMSGPDLIPTTGLAQVQFSHPHIKLHC